MMYHIFRIDWSMTDHDMVVIKAETREKAEALIKRNGDLGPRYLTYLGAVDTIHEVK